MPFWSPDGRRLAAVGRSGTITVWDAESWRETANLKLASTLDLAPFVALPYVSWSPDGRRLARGDDRAIELWDARTWDRIAVLKGKGGSMSWSPDSRRLATIPSDRTIVLWDADTREQTATLRGHTAGVNGVAWSPDGRRLASCGDDSTIVLWDTVAARPITTLGGHTGDVIAVAWSPDGHRLNSLAGCWDVPLGRGRQGLASGQQKPRLMIASTRLSYQEVGQTLMNRRAPTSCKAI
jgi:WD40 repeat protein